MAVRVTAGVVLLALVAWSAWFAFDVWWPEHFCDFDGDPQCVYSGTISSTSERVVRYVAWIAAAISALVTAGMAAGILGGSNRRIAIGIAVTVVCFAVVIISLGALFPAGVEDHLPGA